MYWRSLDNCHDQKNEPMIFLSSGVHHYTKPKLTKKLTLTLNLNLNLTKPKLKPRHKLKPKPKKKVMVMVMVMVMVSFSFWLCVYFAGQKYRWLIFGLLFSALHHDCVRILVKKPR